MLCNCLVKTPNSKVLFLLGTGEVLEEGDSVLVAGGGIGGGPTNGFSGVLGEARTVRLDLKLIADIAFVGFPNAGKSTLLTKLSRASPRIASYPCKCN